MCISVLISVVFRLSAAVAVVKYSVEEDDGVCVWVSEEK